MSEEIVANQKNQMEKSQIALSARGLQLSTLEDMWRFSQCVVKSGFAPKGMEKPESVLIAVEMGYEVGLSPMAALQNTAVVNGRPTIYGDAALALVRGSGLLDFYEEKQVGRKGGDDFGYCVTAKRKGDNSKYSETFTVADAKTAGLWGKPGPWTQYPARMLKFRARGFLLRDAFGDVLKGMRTYEEARDYIDIDAEVVETPKQKLFAPKTPEPEAAVEAPAEEKPEEADAEAANPAGENPPKEKPENPESAFDALMEKLSSENLTEAQLMAWARRQGGILVKGKLDEFGVQKVLNAWETVKEFIAREDSGDEI